MQKNITLVWRSIVLFQSLNKSGRQIWERSHSSFKPASFDQKWRNMGVVNALSFPGEVCMTEDFRPLGVIEVRSGVLNRAKLNLPLSVPGLLHPSSLHCTPPDTRI